jgi:hypothetical protein
MGALLKVNPSDVVKVAAKEARAKKPSPVKRKRGK